MKKVIAICGSPRKKNTWLMMQTVISSARESGAEAELISLADLKIAHCRGCLSCEKTGKCVINDGMGALIGKLISSDVILLGSPSYCNNVTGLMKDFIDRTNPLWKGLKLKGKGFAACCTGSQNAAVVSKCCDVLSDFAGIMGMKLLGSVSAKDSHLGSKAVQDELKKLGEAVSK